MPADRQIFIAGTTAAPASYSVPNAVEIQLKCVNATVDGSAAASQFLATVEIISDGGVVVSRCPCFTPVSAGGTAEISWFRIRNFIEAGNTQSPYEALVLSNPHVRAYYKLDETSGTAMHDSGPLAINGTYQASPTLDQPPLADGKSVVWNGAVLQYGKVLSVGGIVGTGALSVAAWIKTSTIPGVDPLFIVNADDNNFRYFQFRIETTGQLGMGNFDAAVFPASSFIASTVAVNDGAKHFVVGTFSATRQQNLYIDGALNKTQASGLASNSTRVLDLQVAGRLVGGPPVQDPYTGTLDEIAIYNYELPAADIAALYAAGA